jgi:RND family efflux transporter MFP subunit
MSYENPEQSSHDVQGAPLEVWVLRLTIAAAIVAVAVLGYRALLKTAPKREMRPVKERVALVEVVALAPTSQQVSVFATGTAVPVRELALNARVSGEVVAVHPSLEPGGRISAGEVAVTLDPKDYELALQRAETQLAAARSSLRIREAAVPQARGAKVKAESGVVSAEYDLKVELGYQDVAKHEWEMLDNRAQATELEQELTLRKPHLRKAQAALLAAQAGVSTAQAEIDAAEAQVEAQRAAVRDAEVAVAQAKLNLERTQVRVPYDAVVQNRAISVGTEVTTQTQLVSLVESGVLWIEVSVPFDRMTWVKVRQDGTPGAKAVVRPSGPLAELVEWEGEVVRLLPSLETDGRQVQLLVEVRAPLVSAKLPLLLGAFVQVQIQGPKLTNVFSVPRVALHNGTQLWLRGTDGRLVVREVSVLWSDGDIVVVEDGLEEGDMLVLTDIASPVPGMKLGLLEDAEREREAAPEQSAPKAPRME